MARIALPKGPQARRWVRCTDDLRIQMRSRLDKLKVQFAATESEIAQLEGALSLFDQLLPPAEPRLKAVTEQPQRWSPMYPACTRCARTDRPHQARGLCATCYQHDVRQAKAS